MLIRLSVKGENAHFSAGGSSFIRVIVPLMGAQSTMRIANSDWSSQHSLSSIRNNAPTDHRETLSVSDVNPYPIKQLQH